MQIKIFSFQKHFTIISKTLSFRKWFQNEKLFRFENNFTLVSKTFSFRKWFINKNIFVLKTSSFRFKNIFALQMIYKWKRFRFKKNFTFVSKTLSLWKWFINENVFVLKKKFRFGNTFTFFSETRSFCKKKGKSKAFRKQIASVFLVMAHACHPALSASVSTWEGLICRSSYVDVWLQ